MGGEARREKEEKDQGKSPLSSLFFILPPPPPPFLSRDLPKELKGRGLGYKGVGGERGRKKTLSGVKAA